MRLVVKKVGAWIRSYSIDTATGEVNHWLQSIVEATATLVSRETAMQSEANTFTQRVKSSRAPAIVAGIVYVVAVAALWWWYPPSPRLVIHAGAAAKFGGFTPDGQSLLTLTEPRHLRLWSVGLCWPWRTRTRQARLCNGVNRFDILTALSTSKHYWRYCVNCIVPCMNAGSPKKLF